MINRLKAFLCLMVALLPAAGCLRGVPAARAESPGRVFFLHCGGDNDKLTDSNNLFAVETDGKTIPDRVFRAAFIPSAVRDYSNEAAEEAAEEAMAQIREARETCGAIIVSAFSHGGQTAWFIDCEDVDTLILIDGIVYVRGIGSDRDVLRAWVSRLLAVGAGGTDILLFVTNDRFNNTSAFTNALVSLLEEDAEDPLFRGEAGERITAAGEDAYEIGTADGSRKAALTVIRLDTPHGKACVPAAEIIAGRLLSAPPADCNPETDMVH